MNRFVRYITRMTGGHAIPAGPSASSALLGGIGATLAIAIAANLDALTDAPFLMAPFGASCFLAFALPESPLAQPRSIIFGHLISTAVGFFALIVLGNEWWSMALGVGLAIALMQLTRTGHAPAGADPIVVIATEPSLSFLVFPVLVGTLVITLVALIFNNLRRGVRYPSYW